MNWRGRPLTSHEVIVQTIAATTTGTGLRVHAELDTSTYPTGITISDAQMNALPLTRHDWHGDWNYTVRPDPPAARAAPAPARPARTRPDLAWLANPALTGLTGPALDALTAALHAPAAALREARRDRRRGYRPRQQPPAGPRPTLTLTDQILAVILHDRHHLPQAAIAALYQIRTETLSRNISGIRRLLPQTGHTIQPSPRKLTTLADLYAYATEAGITIPAELKTAC